MIVDLLNSAFTVGSVFSRQSYPWLFKLELNAKSFDLYYEVMDVKYQTMPHVGISAREGLLVMYRRQSKPFWTVVDVFARSKKEHIDMRHLVDDKENYSVFIIGPMFAKIRKLYIDVEDGVFISPLSQNSRSILIIGGIHSSGAGCTTSGFSIPGQLARSMDCRIDTHLLYKYNYLADLKKDFQELVTEDGCSLHYDAVIIEADHIRQDDAIVQNNLKDLLYLISFMTKNVLVWSSIPDQKEQKRTTLQLITDQMKANAVFHYLDISQCYDPSMSDMCTFSENFINDTGMVLVSNYLYHYMRERLWK